jgi:guanyl-specific ribonuclease Sa
MGGVYNTANLHVYHYSNNNPVKYVDPNGEVVNLAAAGIGAVIGAGVGAAFAIAGGGSTRDVVAAAAGGAVAGAMGGLTMGASVAVGMAGAGLASMAGYGTQQLVAGEAATPEGYAQSGFSGVAGYAAGQVIGKGITAISNKISSSQTTTGNVPSKFSDTLRTIRETGAAPEGFRGGKSYANDGRGGSQVLPNTDRSGKPITYREWDVNPSQRDVNRGAERIVTGSDGSAYYTTDHYKNLDPMQ